MAGDNVTGEMLSEIAKQIIKESDRVPFDENGMKYAF